MDEPVRGGRGLAGFVRALRGVDMAGAPVPSDDPFDRGTPLAPRDALFREALDQLRDEFDAPRVLEAWEASQAAGAWARGRGWALSPGLIAIPHYRARSPDAVSRAPEVNAATLEDFAEEA